ncbi:MAG: SdpI family protein [Oscillospiraceae bacterium]|nr:SdpI family protein [Oscillospiraceae bacterium]
MIKKNWKLLTCTTLVILIPILAGILLWDRLPARMPTHWNATGEVDGWSSKPFAVFGLPGILLALHWLCVLGTAADPKKRNHSEKLLHLVHWITPALSVVLGAVTYLTALGQPVRIEVLLPLLTGLLFTIIGNYMPKCKQNYTIGIKIPWTLNSEENWNRTHRFASRLWFLGGLLIIATGFLGNVWIFLTITLVMAFIPFLYSYALYRKGI